MSYAMSARVFLVGPLGDVTIRPATRMLAHRVRFFTHSAVRRAVTNTTIKPTSTTASATAASAATSAALPEITASQPSFFRSDRWTKTVGTIGALANWSIPLAGIAHMLSTKDPATTIDPITVGTLTVYSLLFMRWAIAISPPNYPLLLCHVANVIVQSTQLTRYAIAPHPPTAKTADTTEQLADVGRA